MLALGLPVCLLVVVLPALRVDGIVRGFAHELSFGREGRWWRVLCRRVSDLRPARVQVAVSVRARELPLVAPLVLGVSVRQLGVRAQVEVVVSVRARELP